MFSLMIAILLLIRGHHHIINSVGFEAGFFIGIAFTTAGVICLAFYHHGVVEKIGKVG